MTSLQTARCRTRTLRRPRTRLQSDQQELSRRSIEGALRALLRETSYAAISVNDITERAGVSRVTFYRHFPSKPAVVTAINAPLLQSARNLYLTLAQYPNPTQDQIELWIRRIVTFHRRHSTELLLLDEIMALDRDMRTVMQELRDRLFVSLGENIPAYRAASAGHLGDAQVRSHAILLHEQFESFLGLTARRCLQETEAVPVMARLFRYFFESAARATARRAS